MTWHIVTRVGNADQYTPMLTEREPRLFLGVERGDDAGNIGNTVLRTFSEGERYPSAIALDLVALAMAVFSADLRVKREWATDRWTREFVVYVPVTDVGLWSSASGVVEETLTFLTGDRWKMVFRERGPLTLPPLKRRIRPACDAVALFSGGLDSLVGAIDLLETGLTVALVGHYGKGMGRTFQDDILTELMRAYQNRRVPFLFYVQPPKQVRPFGEKAKSVKGEPTMRSRSFLFLSLGVAVLSALRLESPLTVAENGLISLNVPLTGPRLGSASTRTTHPHFVQLFSTLLATIGLPSRIDMPYRFMTKGEMLAATKNPAVLHRAAPLSVSCAKPEDARYRGAPPGTHCGCCVPCIIRRASLIAAGLPETPYVTDLRIKLPEPTSDTRFDLRAFRMAMARRKTESFPRALFNVLSTGPIPPEEVRDYVGVYQRGMDEVAHFLSTVRGEP